jgi:hypothetical protein
LSDLESELKIEREWRQQLEATAQKDKEDISRFKEEIIFLEKIAGVFLSLNNSRNITKQ